MVNILNADLHCHSVISDGTLTPEALAQRAKANGVELWALTDHDEMGGQARAMAAARAVGLPYLTGAEISVTFLDITVHIVGLGMDHHNEALLAEPAERARAAKDRIARALGAAGPGLREMLERVCLAGSALEAAERGLGLPRRSGKTVLKLALQRLAAHYGLG